LALAAGGAYVTTPAFAGAVFGDNSLYNYNYYFPIAGALLPLLI